MIQQLFTRKRIIVSLLCLSVLVLVWFLNSYAWVTFKYPVGEEVSVYIVDTDSPDSENGFVLGGDKGSSKTLLLKRNTYRIEVSSDNKKTMFTQYKKSLGRFRDSLDIELRPQKKSAFSNRLEGFDCTAPATNGERFYYPCDDYSGVLQIGSRTVVDPLLEREPGDEEDNAKNDVTSLGRALMPYGDGLISVVSANGSLFVSKVDPKDGFREAPNLTLNDFKGQIKNQYVSTISSADDASFAIYDASKMEVLVFDDISDSSPTRIDLSKELSKFDEGKIVRVFAAKNQVRVFVSDGGSDTEENYKRIERGEEPLSSKKIKRQVISVNLGNNGTKQVTGLPDDLFVLDVSQRDVTASPSGDLLILPVGGNEGPLFLPTPDSPYASLGIFNEDISRVCWKDSDSFYYVADSAQSIYEYSLPKQASFLVYGGLDGDTSINSLQCRGESLYFDLKNSREKDKESVFFYELLNEDSKETRLEAVLPMYFDPTPAGDTFSGVSLFARIGAGGKSIDVELTYPGGKGASKTLTKSFLLEELRKRGVKTDGLKFNFSY